jgi:hypothetical protein
VRRCRSAELRIAQRVVDGLVRRFCRSKFLHSQLLANHFGSEVPLAAATGDHIGDESEISHDKTQLTIDGGKYVTFPINVEGIDRDAREAELRLDQLAIFLPIQDELEVRSGSQAALGGTTRHHCWTPASGSESGRRLLRDCM